MDGPLKSTSGWMDQFSFKKKMQKIATLTNDHERGHQKSVFLNAKRFKL
jgi:hypothetical protein